MFLLVTGQYRKNPDPEHDLRFKCRLPQSKHLTQQDKKDIVVACTGIANLYSKYRWSFIEVSASEYEAE